MKISQKTGDRLLFTLLGGFVGIMLTLILAAVINMLSYHEENDVPITVEFTTEDSVDYEINMKLSVSSARPLNHEVLQRKIRWRVRPAAEVWKSTQPYALTMIEAFTKDYTQIWVPSFDYDTMDRVEIHIQEIQIRRKEFVERPLTSADYERLFEENHALKHKIEIHELELSKLYNEVSEQTIRRIHREILMREEN